MSSLDSDFDELIDKIKHGREFGHASFEPIYYLVFHPDQILEVKRRHSLGKSACRTRAGTFMSSRSPSDRRHSGQCTDAQDLAGGRPSAPLAWEKTNQSLANAVANGALQARLEAALAAMDPGNEVDPAGHRS